MGAPADRAVSVASAGPGVTAGPAARAARAVTAWATLTPHKWAHGPPMPARAGLAGLAAPAKLAATAPVEVRVEPEVRAEKAARVAPAPTDRIKPSRRRA